MAFSFSYVVGVLATLNFVLPPISASTDCASTDLTWYKTMETIKKDVEISLLSLFRMNYVNLRNGRLTCVLDVNHGKIMRRR